MNEVVVDNLTLKVPANIFEYRHFTSEAGFIYFRYVGLEDSDTSSVLK